MCAAVVAALLGLALPAEAASIYYVSPDGSGCTCTRSSPCPLSVGASNAQGGDTVVLLDGTYQNQPLAPANSGTSSGWITFQADDGAVPILDGGGGDTKATGVGSDTSVYVRYVGIVARNWSSGFSNQWTGSTTEFTANGNWAYINCIGDGNTRNAFAFNSAKGITIHQCIAAHNGTSTTSSWSSGFQLYGVQGSASDNVVDQNVAFENMDAQKHTDGSGFIVDTMVTGVAFVNNLAFLNGGSCIRLTKSSGINIINNTCYHNGRDTMDTGPTNPGEIYFTDGGQTQGLTFLNNIGVASGSTQDPTSAWIFNGGSLSIPSNNKTSASFVGADGTNPDFHLASGSPLIDGGSSSNAPGTDIGFDPKCIKKAKDSGIAVPSWSNYSIDYTYIKGLGGVAKCWQPGKRPAGSGVDIGAYESGATAAPGTGGSAPSGGAPTVASCAASGGQSGGGGAPSSSGSGGSPATGGSPGSAGGTGIATGTGGAGVTTGGATGTATGGSPGTGGTPATGGSSGEGPSSGSGSGCACAVSGGADGRALFGVLMVGLVAGRARRRRRG
ncbi:MAG TPA: MYXO-CTERM sorting domain-containing protein [Polyangia bacterium]|nr:MYXO-CTERM sorting domain-containing protein [Polyangia bacterium]